DEPHAALIAGLLKAEPMATTQELSRCVRAGLASAPLRVSKDDVETSIRRTFQALRIAVNDELSALDTWLRNLPLCLAPGGRVACLSFLSGENRGGKKGFEGGRRGGVFSATADEVVRASAEEMRANPRA